MYTHIRACLVFPGASIGITVSSVQITCEPSTELLSKVVDGG